MIKAAEKKGSIKDRCMKMYDAPINQFLGAKENTSHAIFCLWNSAQMWFSKAMMGHDTVPSVGSAFGLVQCQNISHKLRAAHDLTMTSLPELTEFTAQPSFLAIFTPFFPQWFFTGQSVSILVVLVTLLPSLTNRHLSVAQSHDHWTLWGIIKKKVSVCCISHWKLLDIPKQRAEHFISTTALPMFAHNPKILNYLSKIMQKQFPEGDLT